MRIFLFVLIFLIPLKGWAADPVFLVTHDFQHPYTFLNDQGDVDGRATHVVSCVFAQMGWPVTIQVFPWKRAQQMVRTGEADGFFAASQNDHRDGYARHSVAIADQNWAWFFLADHPLKPGSDHFKERAVVSSFLGANMQSWLQDNGYTLKAVAPHSSEQLLKLVLNNRIDAALANEQIMKNIISTHPSPKRIDRQILRNKPLYVYFSHRFLAKEVGFLERFNAQVSGCRR